MRCVVTEIIAEVASNHGGRREWQDRFVEMAAQAGAEFVKFQSYQTTHLSPSDPQYLWLKHAELSDADHERLMNLCLRHGVKFLTTAFHADRVPFLAGLGLKTIKIGSGEASNVALLKAVAEHPWKVIVSTGLLTRTELERLNAILAHREVVLLHCVSEYPTPFNKVNLGRMAWLEQFTNRPTGYSDHTAGMSAALAAVGMGAAMVEVHLSASTAPRQQEWDKTVGDLTYLCAFRDNVAMMRRPGRMLWSDKEPRPFVSRWNRAA